MVLHQNQKGLRELGDGCWAYLSPEGGWGWSNAGLIRSGGSSLLVDTLFDLKLTADMLDAMQRTGIRPLEIDILVNTHADPDHTFGNQLVRDARIIASEATSAEFAKTPPDLVHRMVTEPDLFGEGARYIAEWMGTDRFWFKDIELVRPTETYRSELELRIGDKLVRLMDVGPAHTSGDTLVHVVNDRLLYTGDILFIGVHPAIWDGSIDGWIAACDRILALDVDYIVPGHGPVTDKTGVRNYRDYLVMLRQEARRRFEAGMGVLEAALDISLSPPFDDWISPERIAGSVNFLYRQFGSEEATSNFIEIFGLVSKYAKVRREQSCTDASCGHQH